MTIGGTNAKIAQNLNGTRAKHMVKAREGVIVARKNITRLEIIQTALRLFLTEGYSNTTIKQICDEIDISKGNLTFYFPAKEDLLAVLVEMLGSFQWKFLDYVIKEGATPLTAYCLELMTVASACDKSETAKDFFISTYTHQKSFSIVKKNTAEKFRFVFHDREDEWTEDEFRMTVDLVAGIEYAAITSGADALPFETRVRIAVDGIMKIFDIPEERRRLKEEKIFETGYEALSKTIFEKFTEYINETNERAIEEVLSKRKLIKRR